MPDAHGEAFCLMKYRSDDNTEEEMIWNSRDGVTPFIITLRSGKQATHVEWHDDVYAPHFKPPVGSRIFVDLTEERARESATRNAERFWNDSDYPASAQYESIEQLVDVLADGYLSEFDGRGPDLIEVTE